MTFFPFRDVLKCLDKNRVSRLENQDLDKELKEMLIAKTKIEQETENNK